MDSDDTEMNAALLHHESAHLGVALQAPGRRDLQPAGRDHVAADEARYGHLLAADVRLDTGIRTDQQIAVAFDVAVEIAEHLAATLDLELASERIVLCQHGRLWLEPMRLRPAVRAGNVNRLRQCVSHVAPLLLPRFNWVPPTRVAAYLLRAASESGFYTSWWLARYSSPATRMYRTHFLMRPVEGMLRPG